MTTGGARESSRPERAPVKRAAAAPADPRSKRGFARWFDGWQPGLLAVFIAAASALVAVPKPVVPVDLPEPIIDARALAAARRADADLADAAERERLDVDVRALGDAYRAYGLADAAGDEAALVRERRRVAEAAARAVARAPTEVLRLRAYELRSFLREVRHLEATGEETDELRELGGGFSRMLERNGWARDHRVAMDDAALATSFKMRWNEVTTLHGPVFQPSRDELRAFYRFLLKHPAGDGHLAGASERYRLKKIDELYAIDPSYPKDLARGVLLYRTGKHLLAVEAFRRHLEMSPDGPSALRAQNYLRAALEVSRDEM